MLTDNILSLIGNTPLIQLQGEPIFAKAEFLNPGGSIKDRVALAMIEGAERDGLLTPESTLVEPTSGNTGIALFCPITSQIKGYPFEEPVRGGKISGVVLCDHIKSLDFKALNIAFEARIPPAALDTICDKIKLLIG